MDVLILRLLLDCSFFLSVFMPLIHGDNLFFKSALLAVLAVWLIWIFLSWKKKDLAGIVIDVVFSEVKILAVIQVYELVIQGVTKWQEYCAPYVFFFLIVAILLLRSGRLETGNQEKGRFWSANSIEIIVVVGAAFILASDFVKGLLWKLVSGVYMKCILPILLFFLQILEWILMLLEPILAAIFSNVERPENEVQINNQTGQQLLELTGAETVTEAALWAKILGFTAAAVVLMIFFYFLYKKLSGAGSGRDRKNKGEIRKSTIEISDRKAYKKQSIFDEKNVRYYYRKFLKLCRDYGVEPEKQMPTCEIMKIMAAERWGEEESLGIFTNLYREVRYGNKKDGDPEKKHAKALYKVIKGSADKDN